MKKISKLVVVVFGTAAVSTQITIGSPVSFQQAIADYKAGKYAQATSELESYKQAYPNNALVHYYLALCKQALGRLEGAKTEYLWVTQNGDVRLRTMAQSGFDQLSRVRSSTSSTPAGTAASLSTASSSSAPTSTLPTRPPLVASAKVKKIIEFYADW